MSTTTKTGVPEVPQSLFSYVRAERRCVGASLHIREQFFQKLVQCAASPHLRERAAHVPLFTTMSVEGGVEGPVPDDLVLALRAEPLLIGWAYQIWNEPQRDESSWGVSRRESTSRDGLNLAAATQIFTAQYMADFLSRHAVYGKPARVCDPACGTGHLLVSALRELAQHSSCRDALGRLFGFDIDPFAVSLCRAILLLEAERLGESDVDLVWRTVQSSIATVPAPFGSLDRSNTELLHGGQYDVILANPPYLGRRKLGWEMREFLDREYPDSAMDLCAAFMERCLELLCDGGRLGLVTTDRWLRLKGYRTLRRGGTSFGGIHRQLTIDTLCELGDRSFDRRLGLHDGVRVVLLAAAHRAPPPQHHFDFITLAHLHDVREKVDALDAGLNAHGRASGARTQRVAQQRLIDERHEEVFLESSALPQTIVSSPLRLADCATVVVGLQTDDDRRFVRYHWEVEPDPQRWRVHAKGGGYGRWFGLNRTVLDWGQGQEIFRRSPRSGISAEPWFDRAGWVYSWFANGSLGLRVKEAGWSFGRAAATGVFCEDRRVVAFLNSSLASLCVRRIGAKVQLPEGVVRRIPIPPGLSAIDERLIEWAIRLKRDIVRRDVSDSTFDPHQVCGAYEVLALEALLRIVEGILEGQVLEAASMKRGAARDAEVLSVSSLPCGISFDSDEGWRFIPKEYEPLRGLVRGAEVTESVREYLEDDDIRRALLVGRGKSSARFPLPADGPLEKMSQETRLHPWELFSGLMNLAERDPTVRVQLKRSMMEQELGVAVLKAFKHQWWRSGYSGARLRVGAQDLNALAAEVGRRVSDDQVRELLGITIGTWIDRRCTQWFREAFGSRPPVIVVSEKPVRFAHILDTSPHGNSQAKDETACAVL